MKKLSTINFNNFWRSTILILVISPSEVARRIWISNVRNSNIFFMDIRSQIKQLSTIKLYNFSRYTTFVLVISSTSEVVWKIQISNIRKVKWNFPWIDGFKWKIVNCKVVQIFEIYIFRFDRFSIQSCLKNLNFRCKKFKRTFPLIDDFQWKTRKLYNFLRYAAFILVVSPFKIV
jgi:hypothetical protein